MGIHQLFQQGINATDYEKPLWIKPYSHIIATVSVVLAAIILVTNGVIMIAYARDRKLRTVSHFFLMNLVLADFLVGMALPLHAVTFVIPKSSLNVHICLAQFSTLGTPLGASILSLLLITIDRFMSVVSPFHHGGKFSKPGRAVLILTSWLIPLLVLVAVPTTWKYPEQFPMGCSNTINLIPHYYWKAIMLPAVFIISASMLMMYVKILSVAHQQIKCIHLLVVQVSPSDRKRMQNIRLARTGFIMLGLFLICWLPFITVTTIREYSLIPDFWEKNPGVCHTCSFLPVILSAINPFIYATRIHRFKLQIKKLLRISIDSVDRYEKYKIRQSFIVKRNDAITNSILANERSDSGVGVSNEAFSDDDIADHPTLTPAESYELFRKNRALSRISETPESYLPSPTSDWDYKFTPPTSTKHTSPLQQGNLPPTEEQETVLTTLADESNLYSTLNRQSSKKCIEDDGNVLFPAPITINCEPDSEYFKLVVSRVVHCSDDSDSDDTVKEVTSRSKKRQKSALIPTISVQRSDSSVTGSYENGGTLKSHKYYQKGDSAITPSSPTEIDYNKRTLKSKRPVHKRSTSTCSITSVMFNNDEVTVEVMGDKKLRKLNGGITPVPSPRPRHDSTSQQVSDTNSNQTISKGDATYNSSTQKRTLLQDIWQGTMSKFKKPRAPLNKMTFVKADSSFNFGNVPDKKDHVIHKRSRSALEEGMIDYSIYSTSQTSKNMLQLPKAYHVPRRKPRSRHASLSDSKDDEEQSSEAASKYTSNHVNQLDLNNKSSNCRSANNGHRYLETKSSQAGHSFQPLSNDVHTVDKYNSLPRNHSSRNPMANADLILPIRFCVAGGLEEGGFITKRTIYRPDHSSRNIPKLARTERSGSQPNLHKQMNDDEKEMISRQKSASASLISNGQQSEEL